MQVTPPPYYYGGDLRMSSHIVREVWLTELALSVKSNGTEKWVIFQFIFPPVSINNVTLKLSQNVILVPLHTPVMA